jgi:hypothetical protein
MAEELAAAHMRSIGFRDARRMPDGIDGGVDVVSANAVAQVKFHAAPIGGPQIQQLRGAAHGIQVALFYSSSGYTQAAVREAARTSVALFTYTEDNSIDAANHVAWELLGENRLDEESVEDVIPLIYARLKITALLVVVGWVSSMVLAAKHAPKRERPAILTSGLVPTNVTATDFDALTARVETIHAKIETSVANVTGAQHLPPSRELKRLARAATRSVEDLRASASTTLRGVAVDAWVLVAEALLLERSNDPYDRTIRDSGYNPAAELDVPPAETLAKLAALRKDF